MIDSASSPLFLFRENAPKSIFNVSSDSIKIPIIVGAFSGIFVYDYWIWENVKLSIHVVNWYGGWKGCLN